MLMMWFNLILGSISIVLTTIPPQQRKRKLKPRIKLCHNIKLCSPRYFCSSSKALFPSFKITAVTTLAVRGDCSRGNRVGRRVGIYWRMDLGFEVIATSSNNPTWTTSVCSCERNHTMNRTVHILVLSTFQPSLFPTPWNPRVWFGEKFIQNTHLHSLSQNWVSVFYLFHCCFLACGEKNNDNKQTNKTQRQQTLPSLITVLVIN